MININSEISAFLCLLGERLQKARLARNETQKVFAARIGITRQSLAKMEQGDGSVSLGSWIVASDILGRLDSWRNVLVESENLFEQFEQNKTKRKRAGTGK